MLYMATGKPAHLGCKFLLYVSKYSYRCGVVQLPAGNTTPNETVITNNSTTIGLFTTDTTNKNLQPK